MAAVMLNRCGRATQNAISLLRTQFNSSPRSKFAIAAVGSLYGIANFYSSQDQQMELSNELTKKSQKILIKKNGKSMYGVHQGRYWSCVFKGCMISQAC